MSDEFDEVWKLISASSNFIGGKYVENFEAEWAAYCGVDCCVGVDSGTSAIELALRGLGIGPGDEVIVPAFTFIGTAEAVAAAISGIALFRGSPLDPGIMRPAIRNAVAIAALVALLGTIGEYFVRQGILRAAAQGLSAPLPKLR